MIVIYLLGLLFFLAVFGELLRSLVNKFTHLFSDLDIVQAFLLDVYLGGAMLYSLALFPFRLFGWFFVQTFFVISLTVLILFNSRKFLSGKRVVVRNNITVHAIVVILLFMFMFWVVTLPIDKFVLGSIHDTSLHSLFTQVIIENEMIPQTLQPYLPEGLVFPQGASVIFALATFLFGWTPAKSVFYCTPLFISISILGAYYLGQKISKKASFGLIFSIAIGFVGTHPRILTWGGNNFAVAFPFFLLCLALLIDIFSSACELRKREVIIIGLLFGYLASIYFTAFMVIVISLTLWLVYAMMLRQGDGVKRVKIFLIILIFSLLPIIPNIFKFVIWYPYPGHNIGLPSDVTARSIWAFPSPLWPFEIIRDYSYPQLFKAMIFILLVCGILSLIFSKPLKSRLSKNILILIGCTFAIPEALIILSWHFSFLRMITGATTCVILFVSLDLLVAFFAYDIFSSFGRRIRAFPAGRHKIRASLRFSFLLYVMLMPFFFNALYVDSELLVSHYSAYAVTTQDDYELMLWMRDNLDDDAQILINSFDAGNFVSSIAQKASTYPFTWSQSSQAYGKLVENIHLGRFTSSEYITMERLGITHVFLGSQSSFWWIGDKNWYPRFFTSNPNFKLSKSVGGAYLYEFQLVNPNWIFFDSFEYSFLTGSGWRVYSPMEIAENGEGYIGVGSAYSYDGTNSLTTFTRKVTGDIFWISVIKEVYLGDYEGASDNIELCFFLNACLGFGVNDALMFVISSGDWRDQLFFSTSKQIAVREELIILANGSGVNKFDLSRMWSENYGASLPNAFFIQIINHDADEVPNLGYVDFILLSRD
ncbi:MAG: hypothetical protein JSV51_04635 [Candidatus Bathyarchaeota archaeon]|nr:MAG: hypothetical protein JSV51_04635 [Candidatus Bathyarchaeota archaeon]